MKRLGFVIIFFVITFFLNSPSAFGERISYRLNLLLHKVDNLVGKKDFKGAIKILNEYKIKHGDKSHYLVFFFLGNCYAELGDLYYATENYKECIRNKPDFFSGWVNLARCYYRLKKYKKAAVSFLNAYKLSNPKDPELMFYHALSLFYAKKNKQAKRVLEYLVKKYGRKSDLRWKETLVHIYLSDNQFLMALPLVEELSEVLKEKERKRWQEIRLYLYMDLHMRKKAFDYLNSLLKEYPLEVKWWKGLAHFYLQENNFRSALVALIIKGFIQPLTPQEVRVVADLFMGLDVPDKAIDFYKSLITHSKPRDITIFKHIARCYLRMYRPEDALKWINLALSKHEDFNTLMLKGNVLYELGRFEEAARVFQLAAQKGQHKNNGQAWLMAGYAWLNADKLNNARRSFKKALKYAKYKNTARRILCELEQNLFK